MQNAKIKCGLTESEKGFYTDSVEIDSFVWYEKNWKHDDYDHVHMRSQLSFVAEGYQYFYIDQKIYLVPQNHVIWIPSGIRHRATSQANYVDLMVLLYQEVPQNDFFKSVHVFAVSPVLKEMLWYASKWSKNVEDNEEQTYFLKAILTSLPNFCSENHHLEIPVPADDRLIPVSDYINENYKYGLEIDFLAEKAAMSVRNLQRMFKLETGVTLQKYIQLIRILKSIELIGLGKYTLTEIAYMVGYKSLAAFTGSYKTIMKSKPKVSRQHMLNKTGF